MFGIKSNYFQEEYNKWEYYEIFIGSNPKIDKHNMCL